MWNQENKSQSGNQVLIYMQTYVYILYIHLTIADIKNE